MRRNLRNVTRGLAGGTLAASLLVCPSAFAQDAARAAASLRIELNKMEMAGENCRTYLLIDNRNEDTWRSLKLDLFALDMDGVAAKRVGVEVGPVPGRKTLIKLFDFPGLSCSRFGRVLLNDVTACEGGGASREQCLAAIEPVSKINTVPFVK